MVDWDPMLDGSSGTIGRRGEGDEHRLIVIFLDCCKFKDFTYDNLHLFPSDLLFREVG